MSIIKDYWHEWLTGETTDNEVDNYIRSSFTHLLAEYRSVHFAKCVLKENAGSQDTAAPQVAPVIAQNQAPPQPSPEATVPDETLAVPDVAEPQHDPQLAQLQQTVVTQADTTNPLAAELAVDTQNQGQGQGQGQEQPQRIAGVGGIQADLQTDTSAPETTPANTPAVIPPPLAGCVCQQPPELSALLEQFDKGDFDNIKKPTWDDCALLEVAIIKLLDRNRLKIKRATLENRYEAVVDPKKYVCYKQSVNRANGDENEHDLKERLCFLVWDLYWAYTTAGKVGQLRQRAIKPILGLLPVIISIFLSCLVIYQAINFIFNTNVLSTFMVVLSVVFFGAFGALISFQRRLSKLEVRGETFSNYLQLCSLGNEGPLALFAGGFFALLLLILFGSGLASAAVTGVFNPELADMVVHLFPQLHIVKDASSDGVLNLASAIANLSFIGYASIAKLLVWSFFAGFAEALIPDAMTRLIDKAKLMEK